MKKSNQPKKVRLTKRRTLIQNVRFQKSRVFVGESFGVSISTLDKKCQEKITTSINGVPGSTQYLQFMQPGKRKVSVVATTKSGQIELRTIDVEVLPRPDDCDEKALFPIIGMKQNFLIDIGATLFLHNANDFNDKDVFYEWRIENVEKPSDKKTIISIPTSTWLATTRPLLDYSFERHLDPQAPFTVVNVKLNVKSFDYKSVYASQRTITVWNSYFLNKEKGIIELKVRPEIYARRENKNYIGRYSVNNQENEDINLTSCQIEFLYDDPEKLSVPNKAKKTNIVIKGGENSTQEFTLPIKGFPQDAFGFAAHFRGVGTKSKLKVFAHVYFEVKTNPRTKVDVVEPEVVSYLDDLRSQDVFLNSDVIDLPKLQEHLDKTCTCSCNKKHTIHRTIEKVEHLNDALFSQIKAIKGNAAPAYFALKGAELEGQECTPEDEANPIGDYVCQLTDEYKWVAIPARLLNARKGDILLSPGGNGPIGGLLKQVNPPQVYSHSGIMINNYYQLRHSTASTEWLKDAVVGSFLGNEGTEGLDPDKLKYAFPGTISQSVDEAFNGELIEDPDGVTDDNGEIKRYTIMGFGNETTLAENIGLVEPLVVKPDPLIEAEIPQVRELLHKVAEAAKQINGHYRFFCYTKADMFFDDFYTAPDRGTSWWASNTKPTVCSSLIWAAIKQLDDPKVMIEGREEYTQPSDLEPTDVGAQVDFRTRDGLYYYTAEERLAAASWLYDYFYNVAYEEAGWWGRLFTDAPDNLANQMCNTFGFDWSGEDEDGNPSYNSDRWKDPGDGRAVSPDDIKNYWDAPTLRDGSIHGLYGYSEKLIYRPARLEYRRISRWVKVEKEATLKGVVLRRGNPVAGALVRGGGKEDLTNSRGEFELIIPKGSYRIEAGKLIDSWYWDTHLDVTLAEGEEKYIVLNLEEPDDMYREVTVRGSMFIFDSEGWFESDETARRNIFMSGIRVGPYGTHAERSQTEGMGGEIRVELRMKFDWQLDASVDVWVELKFFEGTSESTSDLEDTEVRTYNVPKDTTISRTIHLYNHDDGGDYADVELNISNNRQA